MKKGILDLKLPYAQLRPYLNGSGIPKVKGSKTPKGPMKPKTPEDMAVERCTSQCRDTYKPKL